MFHQKLNVKSRDTWEVQRKKSSFCKQSVNLVQSVSLVQIVVMLIKSFNRFHYISLNDIVHENDKTVNFVCNPPFR